MQPVYEKRNHQLIPCREGKNIPCFSPAVFFDRLTKGGSALQKAFLIFFNRLKKHRYNLLPLLTALLAGLAFKPLQKGCLGWVCLLPLLFYIARESPSRKNCFYGGFLAGFLFFLNVHGYIALSVNFFLPRYFGFLAVAAAAFYSAFFWGLFSWTASYILQDRHIVLPALSLPAAWVLSEYLRSLGFLGHTGGFLGYSQQSIPLLQSVSLYGYWGLSFLMVLAQALCFLLWRCYREKTTPGLYREIISAVLIFLALLGAGVYLPSFFPIKEDGSVLRLALVQGNIHQEDILNPSRAPQNFQKYLDLSRRAHTLYAPLSLIVWPETVFSTNVAQKRPTAAAEMAALAEETEADLFLGAILKERQETFNSILLQRKGGNLKHGYACRYDKIRLVPFAEYFPNPKLLNRLFNLNIALGTYTPGTAIQNFRCGDFAWGGIICFESYFPCPARKTVRQGAAHLFVLSNDAWFQDSSGLEQHARAAAFRALETGVGVTQIANTGHTVSYDPLGRELLRLPAAKEGVALLETKMPRRQTLYLLWGNYFLYPCVLILFSAGCSLSSGIISRNNPFNKH